MVGSALHILNRHGPVLAEWFAENSVIADFNDCQRHPKVSEQGPEVFLPRSRFAVRNVRYNFHGLEARKHTSYA